MGWVWNEDNDDDDYPSIRNTPDVSRNPYTEANDHRGYATRKVVSSQCRTEEVEPGKFIRKCEKTEQVFKDCVGRPTEMIQSNKEYTEEDVTDQMTKGSFPLESAEHGPLNFPGLRSDIEAIERSFFDGIDQFFQAAENIKNEFFNSMKFPHAYDNDSRSQAKNHGIYIGDNPTKEVLPKKNSDGDVDLSGLARDV